MSSTTIPLASATTGGCSPMSEVYNTNTNTDWLLFGLTANCAFGGSATGCVNSLNISGWTTGAKTLGQTILDSNFNIQKVTSAGTSGASAPSWNLTQDGATSDSGVTWTNLGQLIPSATQAEAGGTSGIVVDNVSTSAHSSSMYFTTLTGSQTCGTSGGGNNSTCAVNVTQAGLH